MSIDEHYHLLAASELFDRSFYVAQARLAPRIDPIAHYLEVGWKLGLEPGPHFDGVFLKPFYEVSALHGPPAIVWLELSALGGPLPRNQVEAENEASKLRACKTFCPEYYGQFLPTSMDPAHHYVVVGKRLGFKPSPLLDPTFYLERYPDVADADISAIDHFEYSGKQEGRRPLPAVERLQFPPIDFRSQRTIVVVCHEASRTGAPLLGLNLVRELSSSYNVISLLLRGGELNDNFRELSAATIGPLVWEEWHPAEAVRLADRIVDQYKPAYVIANSIETHLMIPAFARAGVPTVSLIHEFAAYTRPLEKMRDAFDWAHHVVFPAEIVAQSSFRAFPGLGKRPNIHVLPQGVVDFAEEQSQSARPSRTGSPRNLKSGGEFLVLGVGSVHIRKGVDLFIAAAAAVRKKYPDIEFRFIWVGHGYDPINEHGYSPYLSDQIERSGLADIVSIIPPADDLETLYEISDALFMCSRLDPQPNVGIDAIVRGLPIVCFGDASGTAEVLAQNPATAHLVVPYLDVASAAEVIGSLARNRTSLGPLRAELSALGRHKFNFSSYASKLDTMGSAAAAALHAADFDLLSAMDPAELETALPPTTIVSSEHDAAWQIMQQWAVNGLAYDTALNSQFRRPYPGFHPQIYAERHPECTELGANPLAHWLRSEKPDGPWIRKVYYPTETSSSSSIKLALHAHFFYEDLAAELLLRLQLNRTPCDLFLTTDTWEKAQSLKVIFRRYAYRVEVDVVPNRGRDIGPFLTHLREKLGTCDYDVIGHVHGKKSATINSEMGNTWRTFLWEHLVGGEHAMVDLVRSIFAATPKLGLLMAEDPHLVGWTSNRQIAEELQVRMGLLTPLPEFFDFPLGTMFWCRPEALTDIFDLRFAWSDYPEEPLNEDGTLLHTLERLIPHAVRNKGYDIASVCIPEITW
ncbi:rhamnan synthesis F family protein [Hyphomicrobium sp. B1]|uniref:rhamnan synthesis F family protein n=1 Tax=Hyphomicrobium sp. B1 TaxID=3075651 RepID=UPI003C3017AC